MRTGWYSGPIIITFVYVLNNYYSHADVKLRSLLLKPGLDTYNLKNTSRPDSTSVPMIGFFDDFSYEHTTVGPIPHSEAYVYSSRPHMKQKTSKRIENMTEIKGLRGLRCYCNLPQCVPHGYMCRSKKEGACFSRGSVKVRPAEESQSSMSSQYHVATRGCVEMLSQNERKFCKMQLDAESSPHQTKTVTDEPDDDAGPLSRGRTVLNSGQSGALKGDPSGALKSGQSGALKGGPSITLKSGQSGDFNGGPSASQKEVFAGHLQCCNQNVCNIAQEKPFIVRDIDAPGPPSLPRSFWWVNGPTTIGVTVCGVVILAFLFAFASRILTEDKRKGRSTEFLQNTSRDTYDKVPSYYIERTPQTISPGSEDSRGCSVLCAKSLQKKQDVLAYCRSLPIPSAANRLSMSCPSSLSFSREDAQRDILQPFNSKRGLPSPGDNEREMFLASQIEGDRITKPADRDSLVGSQRDSLLASQRDSLIGSQRDSLLTSQREDMLLVSPNEEHRLLLPEEVVQDHECSHRIEDLLYSS